MLYYEKDYKPLTRVELAEISIQHCCDFLDFNRISYPSYHIHRYYPSGEQMCGLYENGTIQIWVVDTAKISFAPGFRKWSFPGYKVDRTPIGVIAHETGHWIDAKIGISHSPSFRRFDGEYITNYEPNDLERVAETLRLFILNPDLLKNIAPNRYLQCVRMGLKPFVTDSWKTVLSQADSKYHDAVMNLSEKRKKSQT